MARTSTNSPDPVELLHPFYLDTDMSMAFAAALAGGVALQREEVERDEQESQAARNIRGSVHLFDVLGFGGGRESKESNAIGTNPDSSAITRKPRSLSRFTTSFGVQTKSGA